MQGDTTINSEWCIGKGDNLIDGVWQTLCVYWELRMIGGRVQSRSPFCMFAMVRQDAKVESQVQIQKIFWRASAWLLTNHVSGMAKFIDGRKWPLYHDRKINFYFIYEQNSLLSNIVFEHRICCTAATFVTTTNICVNQLISLFQLYVIFICMQISL